MGSNEEEIPLHGEGKEINVLVTGFGPFREQNPINPAWEIAHSLPPFLPPRKTPLADDISLIAEHPPVRIIVYPEPVKVAYKDVRALVPKLWDSPTRTIDYMLHIGMASGRRYYSIERRGHRDGYLMRDVDGELLGDTDRQKLEGSDWIWAGLPEEIVSDVDVDDVWQRWRVALPGLDVRVSEDAGRYLCDFIYYSSLAELTKKGEEKRALFFHVPVDVSEKAVRTGVEATLELIRAVVQSGRVGKIIRKDPSIASGNLD